MGITRISVAQRPTVAILSMGDEVVPPDALPKPGQIRDVNTYTISSLVRQAGGVPAPLGIARDDYSEQMEAAAHGLEAADMLLFSAGSSVSSRDLTADIINGLGQPGVLVHGLAVRPGKPTIVGIVNGKPAIGLPGNPVSAMVVFDLLVRPALYHLSGCARPPVQPTVEARLGPGYRLHHRKRGLRSRAAGRTTAGDRVAEPVFGKSNLIYTLIRSDGLVQVPLDRGGLYAGETVAVRLYNP